MNRLFEKRLLIPTRTIFHENSYNYYRLDSAGFNLKDLAVIAIGALNQYNTYLLHYFRGYSITSPTLLSVIYEELYDSLEPYPLEIIDRNPNTELVNLVLEFIHSFQEVINEVLYRSHLDVIYTDKHIRILDWLGEDVLVDFLPR